MVVKSPAKLPGVVLQLDSARSTPARALTGIVHTRFAGAKTPAHAPRCAGVKLTKPITAAANGVARIDEALPAEPPLRLRGGRAVPRDATTHPRRPARTLRHPERPHASRSRPPYRRRSARARRSTWASRSTARRRWTSSCRCSMNRCSASPATCRRTSATSTSPTLAGRAAPPANWPPRASATSPWRSSSRRPRSCSRTRTRSRRSRGWNSG